MDFGWNFEQKNLVSGVFSEIKSYQTARPIIEDDDVDVESEEEDYGTEFEMLEVVVRMLRKNTSKISILFLKINATIR